MWEVYPTPASEIRIWVTILADLSTTALATAIVFPTPTGGASMNIVASSAYPLPLFPTPVVITWIPAVPAGPKFAVAAAPTPLYVVIPLVAVVAVLTIVTVGGVVYPAPAFVNKISLTECTP